MLDNFLNKSKPINFIVLLGLFLFAFGIVSYTSFFVDEITLNQFLELGVILLLFISIFFFFNFIITKNNLTFDNSYAYYIFTLTIISLLTNLLNVNLLSLVLIHFLFLRKLYSLYSSKNIIQKLYDCGFWLGISLIIEPYLILFLVLIYIAVFLYQKVTIHTLLTPLIGLFTPMIIYFTYCFWYDKTEEFYGFIIRSFSIDIQPYLDAKLGVFLTILFFLTLISFLSKTPKTLSVNNTFKRSWMLIGFHFIITLCFTLFIENKNGYEIVFLLLPVSVIIANGIELIDKKIAKNLLLFFLLIGTIIFSFLL